MMVAFVLRLRLLLKYYTRLAYSTSRDAYRIPVKLITLRLYQKQFCNRIYKYNLKYKNNLKSIILWISNKFVFIPNEKITEKK